MKIEARRILTHDGERIEIRKTAQEGGTPKPLLDFTVEEACDLVNVTAVSLVMEPGVWRTAADAARR